MKSILSIKGNLVGVLAALMVTIPFGVQSSVISFPKSEASTIGVAVVNLSTGGYIVKENIDVAMIPASILKSVTSAAALLTVGSDFQFETPVKYSGEISDGKLNGDIIIEASGDPTINSRHFSSSPNLIVEIIDALKALGVTSISGDIVVDEDAFADPGLNPQWTIGDAGESYGAGLYGFNYSDNTFVLSPAEMTTDPEQPYIDVLLEPSAGAINVVHGVNSDVYLISGRGLERSATNISLPMNSPATSFSFNLKESLKRAEIAVEGESTNSNPTSTLLVHHSPSSSEILKSLMRRSDNMMAEGMLRAISQDGSRADALTVESSALKDLGISTSLTKIVDGSGLARMDRVTPRFMADVLVAMAKTKYAGTYKSFFPVVGKEGTVKNFLRKTRLAGRLALKSGSINGVHCYAGYKLNASGEPTHAVVIMVNNFFCTRDAVRSAIARWLLEQF